MSICLSYRPLCPARRSENRLAFETGNDNEVAGIAGGMRPGVVAHLSRAVWCAEGTAVEPNEMRLVNGISLGRALVVLLTVLSSAGMYAGTRPNIVLVLADDMGYYTVGALGQTRIKTPNLDKLAANGKVFTQFYANHLCAPSRASLVTGMHSGHGLIRGNYELGRYEDWQEFGQMPLAPNMQTLGTELQRAGYATAVTGKWGLGGPQSTGIPNLQGIDLFYGYLDQAQAHNYYPTHLWRNETKELLPNPPSTVHPTNINIQHPGNPAEYAAYKGKAYSADLIHKVAMKFIEEHKSQPFFLEMAYTLPHMALQVTDRALEQYKGQFDDKPYLGEKGYVPNQYPRATYAAMISLLDEYVGDLMTVLQRHGLDKNTLVIFTADNGAAVVGGADADYFGCSGRLRGRKGSVYEGGIKVPFIAWWPGVIQPGTTSDHRCGLWDLMPTFLEVAGTTATRSIDGLSLLPALKGDASQKEHPFLYWERHSNAGDAHAQAVRFGDWKAVKTYKKNGTSLALYNLKEDPSEQSDVSAKQPELVQKAESYLQTRRLAAVPEWNFVKPDRQDD